MREGRERLGCISTLLFGFVLFCCKEKRIEGKNKEEEYQASSETLGYFLFYFIAKRKEGKTITMKKKYLKWGFYWFNVLFFVLLVLLFFFCFIGFYCFLLVLWFYWFLVLFRGQEKRMKIITGKDMRQGKMRAFFIFYFFNFFGFVLL